MSRLRRAAGCVAAVAAGVAAASGCAGGGRGALAEGRGAPSRVSAAELHVRADRVRRDPLGYLREVEQRCARIEQYTLVLTRQERRGMLRLLSAPERIAARYRRDPFSVYMKWLDPDVEFGETSYIEGRFDDRVRFVARRGLLALTPGVHKVALHTPVVWGASRYPITDFGLERMMRRTLATYDETGGDCDVQYLGLTTRGDPPAAVHHVRLTYSAERYEAPVQELFIDATSDLPRGTLVWFADGRLDTGYAYDHINLTVRLTDDDFLLDAERAAAPSSPGRTEACAGAAAPPQRPAAGP